MLLAISSLKKLPNLFNVNVPRAPIRSPIISIDFNLNFTLLSGIFIKTYSNVN